jgi:hypothetical protein
MPKPSTEYRRGDLHRHHHFDYHAVVIHHVEDYHSCISDTVYENIELIHSNTKIGKLAALIYKAIANMHIYHVVTGLIRDDAYSYLLHNKDTNGNYNIEISKSGEYRCNCPEFINRGKRNNLPCKHIVIVACAKGHEIKI